MNTSRAIRGLSFHLSLGRSLRRCRAVQAALLVGCQQEIISHNPESRAQGMQEFQQGEYADAAGSFRNAVRSDPRDYRSSYYLAMSLENLKQYQQAIQSYKTSLDIQQRTLAGQDDEAQRLRTTEALASCISKSDSRDSELNLIEQKARAENQPSDWLLLGKIYQDRGDADSALDAYNHGYLVAPKDFMMAKQYGLYLEQVGQKQKAAYTLRKAYTLNQNDQQVNDALARMNVVPGPGLKEQSQLAHPPIPEGPLPEVDLSKFKIGGSSEPEAAAQPRCKRQPPRPQH